MGSIRTAAVYSARHGGSGGAKRQKSAVAVANRFVLLRHKQGTLFALDSYQPPRFGNQTHMSKDVLGQIIGWASTLVLLITLLSQIRKEIAVGKADEISPVLFIGQCAASLGFLAYSALVGNVVFVVSNAMILVVALIGVGVRRRLSKTADRRSA
jgi:MtN3 and saliva related transmembrane protein